MREPPLSRMSLQDLPPLRDVIARHGLSAKKSLGQNFLTGGNLLDPIARVPGSLDGQRVYDVGPGPGGLTRSLLKAGADLLAVERDHRALPALPELVHPAAQRRLRPIDAHTIPPDTATVAVREHPL